ncbi:ankyrin repeat-containing domain protein, partial [Gaertneriomyces semiglobifer]
LNDFNVDEFIACARYGELDDLKQMVTDYLQAQNGTLETNNATLRAIYTSKNSSGNTALHMAAANGELEILKYILPHLTMGDVNSTNSDGSTPLHWAALNGKLDCVQLLLDSGADATLQNEQGRSAVTVAEQQGHMDVVNVLLKSYEPEEEGD